MKKPFCLFLTVAALCLSVIAYSQSPNPLYQHLSPSANHIYSVRLGQIIAKGELTGLLGSIPIKDPNAQKFINIIKDPASAGVDLNQEILITQTTASGNGADTLSITQILVRLTDSAKFRQAFLAKEHVHHATGKGATMTHAKDALAWNDQLLVATEISTEKPNPGTAPAHRPAPGVHRPLGELALEKSLASLGGYPGSTLLADQRFLTAFESDEDLHAWTPRADFMSIFRKTFKKMMAKGGTFKGPTPDYSNMEQMPHPPILTTFNFENGRIVFRLTTYNSPEDAALYRRALDHPFNQDLLARIPGGPLLGFTALHFNPTAIPEIMEKRHSLHMVDSMLAKQGLSVSDITGVFGGDIVVAALADTSAMTDTTKKKVDVYFVATLGDPTKLIQLGAKLAAANANNTDTAKAAKMKKLTDNYVMRDNILVVSNSKEMARKYFDNTARRSVDFPEDKSAQYLKVDLKALSAFVTATMPNNPKAMIGARVLEKLDKVEMTSGLTESGNTFLTFQIVTGDPSTNSLKTLVNLMH